MKKLGFSQPDCGSTKVNVYEDPGTSFIRCVVINSNDEYIQILQDGTIQDGIFRFRWDGIGYTEIGSRYFRRSGREEGRVYRLGRFNTAGNIDYEDIILGKDDSDWRTLARYSFNQETLEWTKCEV